MPAMSNRVKTPEADPQARQRSENPSPGATRMCESQGMARGDGQAWNGLIHYECQPNSKTWKISVAVNAMTLKVTDF